MHRRTRFSAPLLFDTIKDSLLIVLVPILLHGGQLLQEFPLSRAQLGGNLYGQPDLLIAATVASQIREAPPLQTEALSRGGSRRYIESMTAMEGGDFDIAPQSCLGIRNGDLADQIISFSEEKWMRQYLQLYIQVSPGSSIQSGLPLSRNSKSGPRLYACWDLH